MTNIVVLIKQVPDYENRQLSEDFTLDRAGSDPVLDEINEKAIEVALQLKEAGKADAVTVLTAGPSTAESAIRRALSMGADDAYHLVDDGLHGSDAIQTGWALASAIGQLEKVDLLITGNESSDGVGGVIPAMLSHFLGLPQLTHLRKIDIDGDKITGERETDDGVFGVEATLPAVVSVSEKIVEQPRFPSFKGIMAAKKKNVESLTLAGIGVDGDEVGGPNAWSTVTSATPKPPKTAGEKVADEGEGGNQIVSYLVAQKLV
jgi:electron transfer flavoprotein beta subunit